MVQLLTASARTASPQRSGWVADGAAGGRERDHGLLDRAREAVADAFGGAAVEAQDVLVEIGRQMLLADGTMVGAHEPALGEAEHEVDSREPQGGVAAGAG